MTKKTTSESFGGIMLEYPVNTSTSEAHKKNAADRDKDGPRDNVTQPVYDISNKNNQDNCNMNRVTQNPRVISRPDIVTEEHWAQLINDRHIKPEWVADNFWSMTAEEASGWLGYKAESDGLMLTGDSVQWQFKPDNPWPSADGKRPKYRSCKDDDGHDAMLPSIPGRSNYWHNKKDWLTEDSWQMDGKPCIVVTEGFFKAMTLTQEGIPAIALLGVEMGLSGKASDPEDKRYLVPTLRKLAELGFGFIIAFDADCATNPNVVKAQIKLGTALQKFEGPVYSITGLWSVDDGKGIDDYIHRNGLHSLRTNVMRNAETFAEWRKKAERQFQNDGRDKALSEADIADELAAEYRELYRYHETFMSWRYWNGKYWEQQSDHRMLTQVRQTVRSKGYPFKRSATIKDVVTQMSWVMNYGDWETADRERYINCQNGVLDLETGEMEAHKTGHGFTSVLPYEVHPAPKADNILEALRERCPATFGFLMSCTGYDEKQAIFLLAVISGVLRWQFSKHQKFIHLTGLPGTGKGTFLRLLQDIVGEENYASSDLRAVSASNSEYEFSRLIGRQLVTFPDERSTVGIDAILKMCGGDSLRFREPYGKPGNAPFLGTVAIASNSSVFKGDTTGLDRRLILVEFPIAIPAADRDPNLNAKLRAEIPSLIPIALTIDSEGFKAQLSAVSAEMSPRHKAARWEQKCQDSAIAEWIEECIAFDQFGQETGQRLYESFKEYCEKSGRSKMSQKRFGLELNKEIGWLGFPVEKVKTGGLITRIGLRIKDEPERETLPLVSDIIALPSGTVGGDGLDSSGTVSGTVETPSQSGLGIVGIVPPNTEQKTASPPASPPQIDDDGTDGNVKNKSLPKTVPTIPKPVTEGDTTLPKTVPATVPQTVQTKGESVASPPRDSEGAEIKVGDNVRYTLPLGHEVIPDDATGTVADLVRKQNGDWYASVKFDRLPTGKKLGTILVDAIAITKRGVWD